MKSVYHILDKIPAIYPEDMQEEYDLLSHELVASGRMRIDTDNSRNFVRFSDVQNNISLFFSYEEVTTPEIIPFSKNVIRHAYKSKGREISELKIDQVIHNIREDCKKIILIGDDLKLYLARIFVQSAHPIVIKWLLHDRVEVFITYSDKIGDVMDILTWKYSGQNSGMQSTDGKNICIYVSCGGNPFAENSEKHPEYGDGFAALARMQIIAAQEIGHYADIKRDRFGNQITRHSANFSCTKATPHIAKARLNDIKRCKEIRARLLKNSMEKLIDLEKKQKFYDQNKISDLKVHWIKLWIRKYRSDLIKFAKKNDLSFIKRFRKEKYMGLMINTMLEDMLINMEPDADVYKRSDAEAQEAINCVEALARVPQQVMKWGYLTTMHTMSGLYKVYFEEVIPSLIKNYNLLKGVNYRRNYKINSKSLLKKVIDKFPWRNKKKIKFTRPI